VSSSSSLAARFTSAESFASRRRARRNESAAPARARRILGEQPWPPLPDEALHASQKVTSNRARRASSPSIRAIRHPLLTGPPCRRPCRLARSATPYSSRSSARSPCRQSGSPRSESVPTVCSQRWISLLTLWSLTRSGTWWRVERAQEPLGSRSTAGRRERTGQRGRGAFSFPVRRPRGRLSAVTTARGTPVGVHPRPRSGTGLRGATNTRRLPL